MTIQQVLQRLDTIINSPAFHADMEDLSFFAPHMKQEQQIMSLLTRHLIDRDTYCVMEYKDPNSTNRNQAVVHDLVVFDRKRQQQRGVRVEAKFHYGDDGEYTRVSLRGGNRFNRFIVPNGEITKDFGKDPDIFIWILSCRSQGELYNKFEDSVVYGPVPVDYAAQYPATNQKANQVLSTHRHKYTITTPLPPVEVDSGVLKTEYRFIISHK